MYIYMYIHVHVHVYSNVDTCTSGKCRGKHITCMYILQKKVRKKEKERGGEREERGGRGKSVSGGIGQRKGEKSG